MSRIRRAIGEGRSTLRRSHRPGGLACLAVLVPVALALGGCSALYPATGATVQAQAVGDLYSIILVPAIVIFVLVEGLLVWSILRYRRRDDRLPAQTHGNTYLEVTWTVVPSIVVLAVFLLSMRTLGTVDARSPDPQVRVAVTGRQWFWDFAYEGKGVSISGAGQTPELVLPVGERVRFDLRSADVIHSFYIPTFLFKRDVIPGVTNAFEITVDRAGVFNGQCAEFCGLGHATMRFSIRAVAPGDFTAWIARQQAAAKASPSAGPSLAPGGATLQVSASSTTSFEQSTLDAPAGAAFAIHFANKEAGVPHDVAIRDASGTVHFKGSIVTGPGEATYAVPALPAGSYTFFCIVHPNMQGTLTVH